jgi:prepilin-type N-terminal cleavage/methylation domain-containing protein/prepilin-type processing-associated H-X9-DG protein
MKRVNAFTLIELLVVVAIIAVLIAMLLPALGSAREVALQTTCGSSMNEAGKALTMYTGDNQESFPYDLIYNTSRVPLTKAYWQQLLMGYAGGQPNIFTCSKYNKADALASYKAGPNGSSATDDSLEQYDCYYRFAMGDPFPRFGYNHYLGCGGFDFYFGGYSNNGKYYIKNTVGNISDPSQRIFCIDEAYSYGDPYWRNVFGGMWQADLWPENIGHRGSANVSFVDGHVEVDKISENSKYLGGNSARYWVGEEGTQVRELITGNVYQTVVPE